MRISNCGMSFGIIFLLVNFCVARDIDIGLFGGYSKIFMDEQFFRKIESNGFELEPNYNLGFRLRYNSINPSIIIFHTIKYSRLKNKNEVMDIACPTSGGLMFEKVHKKYSTSILSFNTGLEYLITKALFSPFVTFNISLNYFDEVNIERNPRCDFFERYGRHYEDPYSSKLRLGTGLGLGTYIDISQNIKIALLIDYDWLKLFGKQLYEDWGTVIDENDFNTLSTSLGLFYEF